MRASPAVTPAKRSFVPLAELEATVQTLLKEVHDNLYAMAKKNLEDNTFDFTTWEEVKEMAAGQGRLCPHQVVRQLWSASWP